MAQYNNQLEPIFNWSFPSNNLINISLVREIRLNESWPQSSKTCHFFFINIVGGVKTTENSFGKTYDFKNQSYSIKYSIDEIFGLANALKYAAIGSLNNIFGGYAKFAKSNNNIKNTYLLEIEPNDRVKTRGVAFGYSQQNPSAKISTSLSSDHAIAMSEILKQMADKAVAFELERMEKIVKTRNTNTDFVNQQTERSGYQSPPPLESQPSLPNNDLNFSFGNDDSFSNISNEFGNMLGNL
jgi:hypothetical protein